jgi:hypothetical protein
MPRALGDIERQVTQTLLSFAFDGRAALESQLASAMVTKVEDLGSTVAIVIKTDAGEPAKISTGVPVTGKTFDASGADVFVELHVVDGSLHELEFWRGDGSPIKHPINLEKLTVYHAETDGDKGAC